MRISGEFIIYRVTSLFLTSSLTVLPFLKLPRDKTVTPNLLYPLTNFIVIVLYFSFNEGKIQPIYYPIVYCLEL